ncbi:MAG: acyl-ACP--UDP-N-acetylglucosamine O-acyltransferase [Bdellovibrionales bacterium]|nr:acyl-ACP--UDP-N-acetylglucosamine O-acyltransferase [Bdellovibrionales bacterium]
MSTAIHPTAIVDPAATLGHGVTVGAYTIIGPHVVIGDNSRIGPHVVIEGRTTLGEHCEVFQFASVGSNPQDLKYHGEPSTLVIGARTKIREFVTLQPGTEHGNMTTTIGENNLFMANSHVGHDCVVGNNNVFANSVALAGHVTIGNHVILGGLVGVHQFVRVGDYAMLGGGSMAGQDIPPFSIGQGDRCVLRGVNIIGLKRAGFTDVQVREIRRVYRSLFLTLGKMTDKIAQISPELADQSHIKAMLDFAATSQRGVASPGRNLGEL